MSLSFPVKREQHNQASEGEEAYQGTDTCMLPYHVALEEVFIFFPLVYINRHLASEG